MDLDIEILGRIYIIYMLFSIKFRHTLLVATLSFWLTISSVFKLYQEQYTIILGLVVWIVVQIQERLLQLMKIKSAYLSQRH